MPTTINSPYIVLGDIENPATRDKFSEFCASDAPSADQIAQFNRPEFAVLLSEGNRRIRVPIASFPDGGAGIGEWYGDLVLAEHARVAMPDLVAVHGKVSVYNAKTFSAPSLETVSGGISVHKKSKISVPALRNVCGGISVLAGANFNAPLLEEAGWVWVDEGSSFSAPSLTTVNDYISVWSGACFTAPVLNTVRGRFSVETGGSVNAPRLKSCPLACCCT